MQSLNVYQASYCSSMLTTSNWASLGEPLQTLSELVQNVCQVKNLNLNGCQNGRHHG